MFNKSVMLNDHNGSQAAVDSAAAQRSALGCGFNPSTQHLISSYGEEDVENEATTEDLLHRN